LLNTHIHFDDLTAKKMNRSIDSYDALQVSLVRIHCKLDRVKVDCRIRNDGKMHLVDPRSSTRRSHVSPASFSGPKLLLALSAELELSV
jgi:hypothetical protein